MRFGQLDVIASLQLFWALPDNYSVDALLPRALAAGGRGDNRGRQRLGCVSGKAADLIVLDRRLSPESTPQDVRATKVTKAFVAGRLVTP